MGTAISALSGLDNPVYTISTNVLCPVTAKYVVTAMTWGKVEAAALASPSYQKLHALIVSGVHDDRNVWPVDLLPYHPHRHALIAAGPVLLYHDRPVIPVALCQEVLETLHGGTKVSVRCSPGPQPQSSGLIFIMTLSSSDQHVGHVHMWHHLTQHHLPVNQKFPATHSPPSVQTFSARMKAINCPLWIDSRMVEYHLFEMR